MELFSPFSQYIIATFLLLFGINSSLYYLILIGKIKDVFKSEELRVYFALVVAAIGLIFVRIISKTDELCRVYSTEEAFRHSYFQVASLITTTGYSTTDFNLWPVMAKTIILIIMFTGAMAGSTSGGFKLSRVVICIKGIGRNIKKLINPRYVAKSNLEGKQLEKSVIDDVFAFCTIYFFIVFITIFLLSFDPVNGSVIEVASESGVGTYKVQHGLMSNLSASISAISNIGPGFEAVGPYSSFAAYSGFSKVVLTCVMMIGRLEILPVLILLNKRTWKKS
jgi:trk system potassium uptake protein TrkH